MPRTSISDSLEIEYQRWLSEIKEMIVSKLGDEDEPGHFIVQELSVVDGIFNPLEESKDSAVKLADERIVGAVTFESVADSRYKRDRNLSTSFVMQNASPILVPGSILISMPTLEIGAAYEPTNQFIETLAVTCKKMKGGFKSHRLILEVS